MVSGHGAARDRDREAAGKGVNMPKKKSTMSHAEAREYWDSHGIDEESPGDEEVEVRASKNLSTILSIRMDREHIDRLKQLAKQQGIGVTTMARMLLNQALGQAGDRAGRQSPRSGAEAILARMVQTSAEDKDGFLVFPASSAEQFGTLVSQTAQQAFLEAFWKQGFTVGHEHAHALFELRELSPEDQPHSRG